MRHQRPGQVGGGIHADCPGLYVWSNPVDTVRPFLPCAGFGIAVDEGTCPKGQTPRVPCEICKLVAETDDQLSVDLRSMTGQAV